MVTCLSCCRLQLIPERRHLLLQSLYSQFNIFPCWCIKRFDIIFSRLQDPIPSNINRAWSFRRACSHRRCRLGIMNTLLVLQCKILNYSSNKRCNSTPLISLIPARSTKKPGFSFPCHKWNEIKHPILLPPQTSKQSFHRFSPTLS